MAHHKIHIKFHTDRFITTAEPLLVVVMRAWRNTQKAAEHKVMRTEQKTYILYAAAMLSSQITHTLTTNTLTFPSILHTQTIRVVDMGTE